MKINIKITYRLKNNIEWMILHPAPEQYFDPDPEEEEKGEYDIESVPRFLDVRDYLEERDESLRDSDITNVNVFLRDFEKHAETSLYHTYWNNGENMLIERRDSTPLESYHEIIIQLTIDRCICETLRFVEENGIMRPTMHSHILNNADGTQSDLNCLR